MPSQKQPPAEERLPVSADTEALTNSVNRLTGELRILRQVIDEVREDFSWVTQNGLPVQPVEYVRVKRMALDPCAEDWGEKLVIERGEMSVRRSAIDLEQIERLVENFDATLEAVAEGRLEVILSALDGVRAELVKAIRNPKREDEWEPRSGRSEVVPEVSILTEKTPAQPPAPAAKGSLGKVPKAKAGEPKSRQKSVPPEAATSPARPKAKPSLPLDDDSPATRQAQHEQWCREVRDPAIEHSEGRRMIASTRDEARLEYEIAPLPNGGWAVNWQYGFLGGSKGGRSHPWVRLASREECLSRVVATAREFFAVRPFDHSQHAAHREMQRRLSGGLFGFIEPESVRDEIKRPTS